MPPGKTTMAEFLEKWLKEYARPNLAPRTTEGYESIMRQHLIPKLGSIRLTLLKPEHIQAYCTEALSAGRCDGHGKSLNPLTVRHHHMALHKALETAVKWGLISRNPADAIDPPRFARTEMKTMNEDDVTRFLEAAKNTPYYPIFYLALYTGMRRSEILALRWNDVDLLGCQVSVSRSVHCLRDRSIAFRQPKSAKGRRMIALSPSTAIMLREYKARQDAQRKALSAKLEESDLLFARPNGSPMLPDTISQAWAKLARKTGFDGIRLHDARHTHASIMLEKGIHPKVVQERLGHASIQTTMDTYSHVMPGLQERAAEAFDRAINTVPKERVF